MESTSGLRRKRRRSATALIAQTQHLEELYPALPDEETVWKIVSFSDLTSTGFLRYVAERAVIYRLDVSTFRIGPKALRLLRQYGYSGRLKYARIVVGQIMQRDRRKPSAIQYWEDLCDLCRRFGWDAASRDNHTKLMLLDTSAGRFVLEGSGNLNEVANWEQYSFAQDAGLYEFYLSALNEMLSPDRRGHECAAQAPEAVEQTVPAWERLEKIF